MALPIVAQEFKIGAVAGLNLNVPSDLKSGIGFRVGSCSLVYAVEDREAV